LSLLNRLVDYVLPLARLYLFDVESLAKLQRNRSPERLLVMTSKRQTKLPLNRDDLETLLSSKINIAYLRVD
jgi:hypothetical protein